MSVLSPAVHCRNRLQSLQRLRGAEQVVGNNMELEVTSQTPGSPVGSSFLNVSR